VSKNNKSKVAVAVAAAFLVSPTILAAQVTPQVRSATIDLVHKADNVLVPKAKALTIEQNQIPAWAGDQRVAQNYYIIAHESGNANDVYDPNALDNEVAYMKNNYNSAYATFFVGGGGRVVQVAADGYVAWGALDANPYSPAQVELARTSDPATFTKDYAAYIGILRQMAIKYGIPLTLDTGNAFTAGIKTHNWISQYHGGDHVDPVDSYLYPYWGITHEKFAHDLMYGVTEAVPTTTATTQPATSSQPAQNSVRTSETGTFTADQTLRVWSGPGTGDTGITYAAGQSFNYDSYVVNGNYVYASYISNSGARRYVAVRNASTDVALGSFADNEQQPTTDRDYAQFGEFTANTTINIRSGASTSAAIVGQYTAGQSFYYNHVYVKGDLVWARYTSYSGKTRYVCMGVLGGAEYGNRSF
jgi:N-acetylmuramoyl-L-alanine amidase CwlA